MLALSHSSSCPFIVMPVAAINSHSLSSVNVTLYQPLFNWAMHFVFFKEWSCFPMALYYFLGLNVYIPCVKSNRVWALKARVCLGATTHFYAAAVDVKIHPASPSVRL